MIGNKLTPFKFWCQKVLPTVYDDSLSYYEYLNKLNEYLNEVIEQINTLTEAEENFQEDLSAQWTAYKNGLNAEWLEYKTGLTEEWNTYRTQLTQAWTETKNYIDNYFNNLDVQTEINNKLDVMATDGTLTNLLEGIVSDDIPTLVTTWLNENVDPVGSAVVVDNSLSISGAAADAKVTGDLINYLDIAVEDIINENGVEIDLSFSSGYISSSTGEVVESVGYSHSNLVPVKKYDKLFFSSSGSTSTLSIASYSDLNTTAIISKSVVGVGDDDERSYTIPDGVNYVSLCKLTAEDGYLKILPHIIKDVYTDIEDNVTDIVTNINPLIFDKDITPLEHGILNSDGTITEQTSTSNFTITPLLHLRNGVKYKISLKDVVGNASHPRMICLYDANENYARTINATAALNADEFITYGTEFYARVNFGGGSNPVEFKVYADGHYDNELELNKDVSIDNHLDEHLNLHIRRPIIAFVFDGYYDLNTQRLGMLKEHGYYGSVAPQYATTYYGNNLYNLRQWAKDGHEILVHGNTILNDSVSEADGAEIIMNSYKYMVGYGFKPYGFIASSGVLADKFYKYVHRWFEWGACTANTSGAQTPYHLFETSDTYQLDRYSMQGSTLAQMKNAVDITIENGGLLLFYAHCNSEQLGYFTEENFEALLTYIDTKVENGSIQVMKPTEAINDYYTVRREDVIS